MSQAEPNPPQNRNDSVRQVVRALFAFRFTALWFFLVFFGVLLAIGYFFPPIYLARATILVKAGRELLPQSIVPITMAPVSNIPTTPETVNSEISIFMSRPVLEAAVDRLIAEQGEPSENFITRFQDWCRRVKLLPTLSQRENMILTLGEKIEPEPLPMTNVVEVEFTSFSRTGAFKTVDYLVDAYLKQRRLVHSNPKALGFFEDETKRCREKLDVVVQKLTAFRVDHDGGDLTLKRTLLMQELTSTESQARALDQLPEGSEELASASVADNPIVADSRRRLLDLRLQLATLSLQFGPEAREVEGVRSQISIAQKDLREQLGRLRTVLANAEKQLRVELREAETRRAEYDALVSEEAQLHASYDLYRQKSDEERIFQEMDSDNIVSVRVLERPTMPAKPWFPNAFILALLGIVLGVPGAITAAMLRAWLAGRVVTVQDVEEKLQVPVLASVARPRLWHGARRRAAMTGDAARIVLASLERHSTLGEGTRVVHVAAASRREGTAAFAAALARAAAGGEREVALLLLGDRPDSLRGGGEMDAAALLRGGKAVEGAKGVSLFDLSACPLAALPDALASLRESKSMVIVAGTPLCGGGDGARFVGMADVALLVLGAGHVHFEVARRATDLIRREARQFAGAVLTGRPEPVPGLVYRWI